MVSAVLIHKSPIDTDVGTVDCLNNVVLLSAFAFIAAISDGENVPKDTVPSVWLALNIGVLPVS